MDFRNLEEWLELMTKIQQVKIMISDKEKIVYSYPTQENRGEELSEEVKKYILILNKTIVDMNYNVFNGNETKNILKNKNEEKYTAQMIVPILNNDEIIGSIIFYRDITMQYVRQNFIKSKIESIKITKKFLEKEIAKNTNKIV